MGGHWIHCKWQLYNRIVGWLGSIGFNGEGSGKHTKGWQRLVLSGSTEKEGANTQKISG